MCKCNKPKAKLISQTDYNMEITFFNGVDDDTLDLLIKNCSIFCLIESSIFKLSRLSSFGNGWTQLFSLNLFFAVECALELRLNPIAFNISQGIKGQTNCNQNHLK